MVKNGPGDPATGGVVALKPGKSATIYDVARQAQVSSQTVTRFLRGYEGIRPETRARVQAALTELNYRPNSAARMLRSNRVNRIAVLAHDFEQTGPSRMISGATREAHRRGYVLDIIAIDGNDPQSVGEAITLATDHQVAGLLATAQSVVVVEQLNRRQIDVPMVIEIATSTDGDEIPSNHLAGRLAADHLIDLGHHRLGYLSGPPTWLAAQERQAGFAERVAERGADVLWISAGDWSASSGYGVWPTLTPAERRVTAVAVANDSMAVGLISSLDHHGLACPEDVSVIGTDDFPEACYLRPPLSTIAMDFEGDGVHAISQLINLIEGVDDIPVRPQVPQIVARGSTRAVSGR